MSIFRSRSGLSAAPAILSLALLLGLACLARPAVASGPAQLASRADALYEERGDLEKASQAVDLYRRIVAADPGDLTASLRLCELLVWLGAQSPDALSEELFRELIVIAQQARRAHPQDPGPLFFLGVGQGMLADVASVPEGLLLVKQARKNMDELLKQNPDYYYGGPDRVLGRIYTKLPWFVGGDTKLAEQHYKQAIRRGPHYWLNHLYLAELYFNEGEEDKARHLLEQVVEGKSEPTLLPESRLWQKVARQALANGAPPNHAN